MTNTKHKPTQNNPNPAHIISDAQKKAYIMDTLNKFLDKYIFVSETDGNPPFGSDGICQYAVNVMKSFIILADFKDAVATGNGEHLSTLRKQLLKHFFSASGFNEYAIEMLVNVMQSQILLSKAEAHQCKWAATVNWNGGQEKNIEIDLFQENRNNDMKTLIKSMGANKSDKAISRASKASGGVKRIVESFEKQVHLHRRSSLHSHKSSTHDEVMIQADLRNLRPFKQEDGRTFESFANISHDPIASLDKQKFQAWIEKHKKNILMHFPVLEDVDEDGDNLELLDLQL